MDILNFRKSNVKLQCFGYFSCFVRSLIVKISSSEVTVNTTSIHSVRHQCKRVILFHTSSLNLSKCVDHPAENPPKRAHKLKWRRGSGILINLAHAQTKCPCARLHCTTDWHLSLCRSGFSCGAPVLSSTPFYHPSSSSFFPQLAQCDKFLGARGWVAGITIHGRGLLRETSCKIVTSRTSQPLIFQTVQCSC